MIIDLLGGTYEQKFKDWNSQRTINWYPKISKGQEKNKTQMSLVPRPGLTEFAEASGVAVRGCFTARTLTEERYFAIVLTSTGSNILYELFYDGTITSRGTLTFLTSGSKSKAYMEVNNNNELMIQDPLAGYIFELNTNTLTQITDADYPGGTTLAYADGYFIISDNNGRVSFSELGDGLSWNGLDFFTPSFKPDKVKAVATFREEIYCFGDTTIEVYINDGETPFIRQSRTSIYYGLTARDSIASWHGGVFFLGKSVNGGSDIYMMGTNYALNPISTPAIAQKINEQTNEDAEGYVVCSKDGHIFYHLHLPSLSTTLVYDVTTEMWHERQSQRPYPDVDGTYQQDMYRGKCFSQFKGLNLFGDWYSGKIFKEDGSVKTDDGNVRLLKRTSPVFHNELKYISVYGLEIDMNSGYGATSGQGSDPVMMFRYSLDGGNTFESEQFYKIGMLGNYDYKVEMQKLGTARNWVVDFSISDPIDITIMQASMRGTVGSW